MVSNPFLISEPKQIIITKTRTVKEIYSLAFDHAFKDGKGLLLPLICTAIPIIIIGSLGANIISGHYDPFNNLIDLKPALTPNYYILLIIFFIVFIAGLGYYNFLINKNLIKGNKSLTGNEAALGPSDVRRTYPLNFFIIYIVYYIMQNASTYLYDFIFGDEPKGYASGIIEYIWLTLLDQLPLILIMPPVFFFCFAASFVSYRDHIGATEALGKVWQTIKEKPQMAWYNSFIIAGLFYLFIFVTKLFILYGSSILNSAATGSVIFFYAFSILEIFMCYLFFIHTHISMVLLYGSFEDEEHGHFVKDMIDKL